jgi:hypothetical protein
LAIVNEDLMKGPTKSRKKSSISAIPPFTEALPILNTDETKILLMTFHPPVVASYGNSPAVPACTAGFSVLRGAYCHG